MDGVVKMVKNCIQCGKQFKVPFCHSHRVSRCSPECASISRRGPVGVIHRGIWYRLGNIGYYVNSMSRKLLHRVRWEELHGPIPPGHDIHHRNGDRTDNRHENLEIIPHSQHASMHNKERHAKRKAAMVR